MTAPNSKHENAHHAEARASGAGRVLLGGWSGVLFFAAAATGFYVLLEDRWGLALKAALLLHPALGLFASVWLYRFTRAKALAAGMPQACARLLWAPGAVFGLLLLPCLVGRTGAGYVWPAALAVLGAGAAGLRWPERMPDVPRGRYYYLSGGLAWAAWMAVLWTGLAALLIFLRHNIIALMQVHRVASYTLAALFFAHLFGVRPMLGPGQRRATPVGAHAKWGIALCAAVLLAAAVWAGRAPRPQWTVPVNTIPMEQRAAADRQWAPTSRVSVEQLGRMDVTAACGNTGGCHAEILDEHVRSIHNITVQPRYFQVNLNDMAGEIGMRNQIICAGCHYPVGALDQRKAFPYFKDHNNFSCVFCHSITDAGIVEADKRLSWYTVAPPWGHLGQFPYKDGRTSRLTRIFIRLNAAGHRRAFKKPFHSTDAYCNGCHHLQMPPLATPGLKNPRCILCHMQPQRVYGGSTKLKSHLFAGASVGPALLTGDRKTADIIRGWAEGRIVPQLKGWETLWNIRLSADQPVESVPWVMISFYYDEPPRPGQDFTLYVLSTNTGLGHNFPSASIDLYRAWLRFEARTGNGRVFCEQGATPPTNPRPRTDTPSLGGYMVGKDGDIVIHNRVWQIREKVIDRVIPNLRDITDTVTCRIPEDAGHEIRVNAQWDYIKLDQHFLDYVYGPGAVSIPPIIAGRASTDIPVSAP